MKILFFLLALANVGLFMWEYHKGAFALATETSLESPTDYQEQIVLVSELTDNISIAGQTDEVTALTNQLPSAIAVQDRIDEKSEQLEFLSEKLTDIDNTLVPEPLAPATTPNDAQLTAAEPLEEQSLICFEAGPFANDQVYKIWESRLNGFIKSVNKEQPVIRDYLVYYPAEETLMQSEANLKMLKDKGINDLWLLTQGIEQGQISVGVFNREEKALNLKNQMLAKGINVEIKARYKSKVQKFAVIKGEGNIANDLGVLMKAYPNVVVKQIASTTADNCL